jgi:hypothetical protein
MLSAPDHITVSRRAMKWPVIQPAQVPHGEVDVLARMTARPPTRRSPRMAMTSRW